MFTLLCRTWKGFMKVPEKVLWRPLKRFYEGIGTGKIMKNHVLRLIHGNYYSRPSACNFIKKRFRLRCFPGNFAKLFRTSLFYRTPTALEHWLLLIFERICLKLSSTCVVLYRLVCTFKYVSLTFFEL